MKLNALTPCPSSGLQRDLAGDRLDSMSLPVKSSSDSSKDDAEDRQMEEESDSFLGERISAGDPPQPLSEHGDSSSPWESRHDPVVSSVRALSRAGGSWEGVGLGSRVMMSLGIVPGKLWPVTGPPPAWSVRSGPRLGAERLHGSSGERETPPPSSIFVILASAPPPANKFSLMCWSGADLAKLGAVPVTPPESGTAGSRVFPPSGWSSMAGGSDALSSLACPGSSQPAALTSAVSVSKPAASEGPAAVRGLTVGPISSVSGSGGTSELAADTANVDTTSSLGNFPVLRSRGVVGPPASLSQPASAPLDSRFLRPKHDSTLFFIGFLFQSWPRCFSLLPRLPMRSLLAFSPAFHFTLAEASAVCESSDGDWPIPHSVVVNLRLPVTQTHPQILLLKQHLLWLTVYSKALITHPPLLGNQSLVHFFPTSESENKHNPVNNGARSLA